MPAAGDQGAGGPDRGGGKGRDEHEDRHDGHDEGAVDAVDECPVDRHTATEDQLGVWQFGRDRVEHGVGCSGGGACVQGDVHDGLVDAVGLDHDGLDLVECGHRTIDRGEIGGGREIPDQNHEIGQIAVRSLFHRHLRGEVRATLVERRHHTPECEEERDGDAEGRRQTLQ